MKYTDDKNSQIVLSLLKQYGIKKIVISPGTTNVPIARSVQNDDFFEIYSVVDERSATYFATGLSFITKEPVVISCTGATASRNYLSGLTEAFYRKLPIIALTSQHHTPDYNDLVPQVTDRRVSQNDVKKYSALLPYVRNDEDYKQSVFQVNYALHHAIEKGGGPVHINVPVSPEYSFTTEKLPSVQKIDYYDEEKIKALKLSTELNDKKVAIFMGSHNIFSEECIEQINKFVVKNDIPVFYDHTSSYVGKNGILSAQISDLLQTKNLPDLIIDLGSICGEYSASQLFKNITTWRISEDGKFHNRLGVEILTKVFECSEISFFNFLNQKNYKTKKYYSILKKEVKKIKIPTLPLSNTYISMKLSQNIPDKSILHLGILNSLRNMNFFELNSSIITSSNVGGFGIDGALSTIIGQSVISRENLSFVLLGDLAFFYDMNALGIKHISKNLRILLVNNGLGVEFRLNSKLENQWGADTDDYIAAKGHNGSAKLWAQSMKFEYMEANTKEEFDKNILDFCSKEKTRPIVFEVFTKVIDEQQALRLLRDINRPIKCNKKTIKKIIKKEIKKIIPKKTGGN
ncbi:MAG: thiamine pyrophosphate-binding protein [Bacilli bacterium]|nr:thiamine pyrophosphate-binding protein [Bacilli bacterium]